jgi:hypothetical protein
MATDPALVVTDPVIMFHQALVNAAIPIDGVGLLPPGEYPPEWHIVTRPDALVVQIGYRPEATPAQITEGDNIVMTLDISPKRTRKAWDIYTDVRALPAAAQTAIWDDLRANNAAKIKSIGPPQDGSVLILHWCITSLGGATAAEKNDASARMAALYTQQNVHYLEHPPFASTINVPGWEIIPPA